MRWDKWSMKLDKEHSARTCLILHIAILMWNQDLVFSHGMVPCNPGYHWYPGFSDAWKISDDKLLSETKGVKLLWSWRHSTYTLSPQLFKMLLLPHTFMDLFETCTQCSPGSGPFGLFRNFCFRVPYGPYFLILWNSAKHFYRFSCTLLMVSHNDTPFVVPLGCSGILDPIPKMGPRVHLESPRWALGSILWNIAKRLISSSS